jgi:lysophospholipase L1-like esterase
MRARCAIALAAVAATLAGAGAAQAQAPPLALTAEATEAGWITVRVAGAPGTRVTLAEAGQTVRGVTVRADGTAVVRHLSPWRCDATTRTITAAAGPATVAATVTTPSCADRFVLRAPRTARAGRAATVRVTDRWRVGGTKTILCLRMRGRDVGCASATPAARARDVRLWPVRSGAATITLTAPATPSQSVALRVRPRQRPLRVLAAGDSMMQVLDTTLGDRLPRAVLHSDTHVSTGITKPSLLNWPAQARRVARAQRPDATVVFLGANDGFGLPGPGGAQAPCCSEAWVDAYAARARSMMAAYSRAGAGRVYWLTLPVPRRAAFAQIFTGVNQALKRAAQAFPSTVRIVDLVPVISPGGRFRQALRQADGVHLTPAGDKAAAALVVSAMRRDGLR